MGAYPEERQPAGTDRPGIKKGELLQLLFVFLYGIVKGKQIFAKRQRKSKLFVEHLSRASNLAFKRGFALLGKYH